MTDISDVVAQSERDAERARARLQSSVDKLKDNLSPGPLVSELMWNSGKGGEALMNGILQAARENPVAVALIGFGAAMLLLPAGERHRKSHGGRTSAGSGVGDFKEKLVKPMEKAAEKVSDLVSSLGDRAVDIKDRAGDVADHISGAAEQATETTRDYLSSGARYAKDQIGGARSSFADVKRSLSDIIEEQPFVIAALGVAAGAAIGAALPVTRTESDYLGGVSDSARRAASDIAIQQYGRVKSAAQDTLHEVADAAADDDDRSQKSRMGSKPEFASGA
ncbi:hypothetical protein [Methylocapsa palsarum]|uniref:DUF3618 domain-containing protein n=1 Tax=Methylocapsa palsarum TaxID=1612308 RepID=A0A1I3XES7_9HYPH|nr:hypothetical protein [Methylocapsa palsarum]SFK18037.1 hypothetical protein SAMN05444581_10377 [Methylocapsa palsarum]